MSDKKMPLSLDAYALIMAISFYKKTKNKFLKEWIRLLLWDL
jgi:hypothetical protein